MTLSASSLEGNLCGIRINPERLELVTGAILAASRDAPLAAGGAARLRNEAGGIMNRKKEERKHYSLVYVTAALALVLAGSAGATPPSGILSGTVFARAPFVDPVDVKFKIGDGSKEVLQVRKAGETVMQQIVIAPGGSTGWHSHPGPVVVLIKSGEMLFSSSDHGCESRLYRAGDGFIDSGQGHVHIARNPSLTENLEIWATYFDVPPGGAFRIDAPDPGTCG
jgi:quercetin dioxygenase-like cupin family protein